MRQLSTNSFAQAIRTRARLRDNFTEPQPWRPLGGAVRPSGRHSPRLRGLRLEILLAIHANQLEEIAQRERPDEQAEQAEVAHPADGPDQRDERMDRGKA